jgi:predicted O-methyltransferase YrrM
MLERNQDLHPPEFTEIWEQAAPYTMTSIQRGFALWLAVNRIIDTNVPGAFVECGVWKGGSAMIIALTLLQRGVRDRDIFLFDTFAGMTAPSNIDIDYKGHHALELMQGLLGHETAALVAARVSLDEVKTAMVRTDYDPQYVHYIVGDVRQTLQRTQTLEISLLRIDTDFYDSTLAELIQLYPRVSQNGLVIVDDYGHWHGARRAVDDYFTQYAPSMTLPMFWPIDYTGRAFTKVEQAEKIDVDRYEYVPPGFVNPRLLHLFQHAAKVNPYSVRWPYLRSSIPHIFRSDTRSPTSHVIGNASYEEAVCLHTVARQFANRRGLEVGTHFGWSGVHLLAAGLDMDFVDPACGDSAREAALRSTFDQVASRGKYRLWPGRSPDVIETIRQQGTGEQWAFVFIDGDHDGDAPSRDAHAIIPHCAENAVVMFHDLTSPFVARGLRVFKEFGWSIKIYNTMQILGLAWRGKVQIPEHIQDPNVPRILPEHLVDISCS